MTQKEKIEKIEKKDLPLLNDLHAALQEEKHNKSFVSILFITIFIVVFLIWSYFSPLDEITNGMGRVVTVNDEQVIQNLDPGVIKKIYVKEGDKIKKGDILIKLDDARSSAVLRESEAKANNLKAIISRLKAEAYNQKLVFPKGIPINLKKREIKAYNSRYKAMKDAVSGLMKSKKSLDQQIYITTPLVQKGLVSKIELLKMQQQSHSLQMQIDLRRDEYRTKANDELVEKESALDEVRETITKNRDMVKHSEIRSPINGIVKNMKIKTIGGVINPGVDIMEIIPEDESYLVEAYIKPKDIAFIRPGQEASIKITSYEYSIYGGLKGIVKSISPDTLNDKKRISELNLNSQDMYYRVFIETKKGEVITDKNNNPMSVIPGMITDVNIKTGNKTIFQYLIKPLTRMKEAMTER